MFISLWEKFVFYNNFSSAFFDIPFTSHKRKSTHKDMSKKGHILINNTQFQGRHLSNFFERKKMFKNPRFFVYL